MKISAKRVLKLFAIACAITGIGFIADYGLDLYRQATTREVGLESGPGYSGMDDNPMNVLAAALPKDRLAARFRVKWSDVHPGLSVQGWLLYDRRQSTLQFDNSGCFNDVGDKITCSDSVYSFTNVTDGIITDLSSTDVANLPKLLPMYGCRVQKIKDDSSVTHAP